MKRCRTAPPVSRQAHSVRKAPFQRDEPTNVPKSLFQGRRHQVLQTEWQTRQECILPCVFSPGSGCPTASIKVSPGPCSLEGSGRESVPCSLGFQCCHPWCPWLVGTSLQPVITCCCRPCVLTWSCLCARLSLQLFSSYKDMCHTG